MMETRMGEYPLRYGGKISYGGKIKPGAVALWCLDEAGLARVLAAKQWTVRPARQL